jgi:hypothetical protein
MKDTSKEKQIEMEKAGRKITVPQSKVASRKVHGYTIIEKKNGGK